VDLGGLLVFVVAVKPLSESMAAVGLLVSNFRRFKGGLSVLFMDSRSNGDSVCGEPQREVVFITP
jgi:hypothetical protein